MKGMGAPIVLKRRKAVAQGAHQAGAWKVAIGRVLDREARFAPEFRDAGPGDMPRIGMAESF